MVKDREEEYEYKGCTIRHAKRGWYVYAPDKGTLSRALASKDEAERCVEVHIRRGGK